MQMNRVKRAIIMAAGVGNRMHPVTLATPKPLVKVHGVRMIDTAIRGLLENGIEEIIIVVGYLKERFQEVAADYPQVRLLENPWHDVANNISSIYTARDYLEEAMILEGDQYFLNGNVLMSDFEHSEYNAAWSDEEGMPWVVDTDEKKKITACHVSGGGKGYVTYGVSRWTPEGGRMLKKWLEYEFEVLKNYDAFWDTIPLLTHPEDFDLYVRPTDNDTHVELDSVEEIAVWDPQYRR